MMMMMMMMMILGHGLGWYILVGIDVSCGRT
jgi:hypothetical protein